MCLLCSFTKSLQEHRYSDCLKKRPCGLILALIPFVTSCVWRFSENEHVWHQNFEVYRRIKLVFTYQCNSKQGSCMCGEDLSQSFLLKRTVMTVTLRDRWPRIKLHWMTSCQLCFFGAHRRPRRRPTEAAKHLSEAFTAATRNTVFVLAVLSITLSCDKEEENPASGLFIYFKDQIKQQFCWVGLCFNWGHEK